MSDIRPRDRAAAMVLAAVVTIGSTFYFAAQVRDQQRPDCPEHSAEPGQGCGRP